MCALGILLHIYKNPVSTGYFLNIYPKAVYTKNFLTFAHTFIPIHSKNNLQAKTKTHQTGCIQLVVLFLSLIHI